MNKSNVISLRLLAMVVLMWTTHAFATPAVDGKPIKVANIAQKMQASQSSSTQKNGKKTNSVALDKKTATKKAGVKKLVGKKSADKQAVNKKAVNKKAVNKKAVNKKAVDKKVIAKKSTNQKLADKKTVTKKSIAKKTIHQKTSVKKSANTAKLKFAKHIPHEHLRRTAKKHGIDPMLVKAIIKVESGGRPNARSPKGAIGLMQVMPATARQYGRYNLRDPKQNITVGVRHFANLKKRYKNTKIALAAYNAGEGNVEKYGGIPPFKETKRYVANTIATYRTYKANAI